MDGNANSLVLIVAAIPLLAWVYLLMFRGRFWRASECLSRPQREPESWPEVVAVVPARNEAEGVGRTVASLLSQDYPGIFSVVLVDDHSDDGTAEVAAAAATAAGAGDRLTVLRGAPLEPGWTGKLWAVEQGVRHVARSHAGAAYLWLTDGDIEHDAGVLRLLVARAEADSLDLVSLMALLRARGFWEKLLLPAFVFFFQKLYPFPWVNDPRRQTAAAAGGCVLLRRKALAQAGGITAIRGALIDDCALARRIRESGGAVWLGLTRSVRSLRRCDRLSDIWNMVARTAYTQINHSPLLLLGTVLGMTVIYLTPPLLVVLAPAIDGPALAIAAMILGLAGWLAMVGAFLPTARLYGLSPMSGLLLPIAGFLFTLMTLDSALRSWRGRDGQWKGRTYPEAAHPQTSHRRASYR
jgi:hopene-associated glycosyltransferase HpnB